MKLASLFFLLAGGLPGLLAQDITGAIGGTQVREPALGTRNFAQLVSLMPGVIDQTGVDELFPGASGANGTNTSIPYSVNGMRNSSNNWTVDGADNIDRGSNLSLGNFPS